MNLNKILASFKKTQAQLDKYVVEKNNEIIELENTLVDANYKKRKAITVNENLKNLLGEA